MRAKSGTVSKKILEYLTREKEALFAFDVLKNYLIPSANFNIFLTNQGFVVMPEHCNKNCFGLHSEILPFFAIFKKQIQFLNIVIIGPKLLSKIGT